MGHKMWLHAMGEGVFLLRFDSSIVFVHCVIIKCLPEMSVCYGILLTINWGVTLFRS